ncbi:winged helix-turn-helix transcriptional regulator [Micromonospora chalcea]|uniref:winged helix-turn-helix transcriptional regulator n=1 Tax=Micromonospora chalcea TaxID=1874 RepID=UPI00157DBD13|nr:winged helix-turn-helix transcriptional regulator [Micromonospora chalcea]
MAQTGLAGKRSYHQYCGLASALDVLGERWTLLIIRELLMGPRRYSELLADLPGIGTNLLADRLKFLVDSGVLRQVDVHGTGGRLSYELTPTGQALRPMVLGLAHWGLEFVGDLSAEDTVRPHWGFLAVEAMFQWDKISPIDESYQFQVDDEVFRIDVAGGVPRVAKGPSDDPAMVATTDAATFVRIGAGRVTPLMAMVGGQLKLEGDIDAVLRCCELLGLDAGAAPAAQATSGH